MNQTRRTLCSCGIALAFSVVPSSAAPDLGVRYISRYPLYWRYNVQYSDGMPYLAPTHGNQDPNLDQHWPAPGEPIAFTAHVRNHGDQPVSGFEYQWYVDDEPEGGILWQPTPLAPGAETTVTLSWMWPMNLDDHRVRIVLDPSHLVPEGYLQNNTYTDWTNALSFSIWVEEGLYDRFNARQNGFGTYSFDDWFRWQFDEMKATFARSAYPGVAPNGVLERIRVEEINVIPFDPDDLDNYVEVLAADPHAMLNDGRWTFTSPAQTLVQKQADWDNYVNAMSAQFDGGLIHEMTHQLGAIDEYQLNVEYNQVQMQDGTPLGSVHAFHHGGRMGGGYVLPSYDDSYYDSHTAGYLNRNLHHRRGYYGEYLYDTPAANFLEVFDIYGRPLPNAQVTVYQKYEGAGLMPNQPVSSGTTDVNGRFLLPNRPTPTTTTATGHSLVANPFGKINVVGVNGTLLVKIARDGQEDFRWLELIQLNLAYWNGNTDNASYALATDIIPVGTIGTQNLALNRPATASSNAPLAANANDGDTTTPDRSWRPDPTSAGQWWRVDLGRNAYVARIAVYPSAVNPHDWFSAFHVELSTTGAFAGEQRVVPIESNWDETRASGDFEIQRLSGLRDRAVYTFAPTYGRYLRVVSDVAQNWVQLEELQAFEFTSSGAGEVSEIRIAKTGGNKITLSWNPSCDATDSGAEVYQGTLGNFTSHTHITCNTGANRFYEFNIPSGNRYFLVVSRKAGVEGSYGQATNGERPASGSACLTRVVAPCPP